MRVTIKDKKGRQIFRGDSAKLELDGGVLLALSDLESTALLLAADVVNTTRADGAPATVLGRLAGRVRELRAAKRELVKRRLFRDALASMPEEIKQR